MAFRKRSTFGKVVAASTLLVSALGLSASAQRTMVGEWPQWQGPNRDGVSLEKGLLQSWPAAGPALAWTAKGLGEGHSTPSVAGGRVYTMGLVGPDEQVIAINAADGKEVWHTALAPRLTQIGGTQGGFGPRCTPTVVGNRLYVEGVEGTVACLDTSGKILWKRSLVADFGGKAPTWGYSESPLVDGTKVIVSPGGHNTIVALNAANGQTVWSALVPQSDGAHYSSPIVANIGGVRQYVQMMGGGVIGVAAADGKVLWRYDHPANHTANCNTAQVHGNFVFAASGYNTGGGLAEITSSPAGFEAKEVWFSKSMRDHHGGVVLVNGYLYGYDDQNLTCLDYKTGDVKWFNRSTGKGAITYADGMLYCRGERGTLALVKAIPDAYTEVSRFEQPQRSNAPAWAHPVIAGGKMYIQDQDNLFCYNVKG